MSGATGAGASGPGNGVRGSATHQAEAGGTASAGGGRTVTDTREPDSLGAQPYPGTQGGGRQYQGYDQYEAGPLPGERPGADAGPAGPAKGLPRAALGVSGADSALEGAREVRHEGGDDTE